MNNGSGNSIGTFKVDHVRTNTAWFLSVAKSKLLRGHDHEKLASKLCLISQHTQWQLIKSISEVGSSAELETLTRTFCPPFPNFTGRGGGDNVLKFTKWLITQPRIVRFRSISVQSLITGHPIYNICSISLGQRSRSQRDVMGQKIC